MLTHENDQSSNIAIASRNVTIDRLLVMMMRQSSAEIFSRDDHSTKSADNLMNLPRMSYS